MEELSTSERDLWLRRYSASPRGRGPLLVCFPHAGGAASFFVSWPKLFPRDIEVLAVQYPGRQDRRDEPFATDVMELSDRIAEEVTAFRGRPIALFGHSLGATVAFEVAVRLARQGSCAPVGLFASGRPAPSVPRQLPRNLGDESLLAETGLLGGTPAAVLNDAEMVEVVLPPLRADYRMIAAYQWEPGPPLRCPISVFWGQSDARVTFSDARAWRRHTEGPCTLHSFPGGHFYMNDRQVLARLIRFIAEDLMAFTETAHAHD